MHSVTLKKKKNVLSAIAIGRFFKKMQMRPHVLADFNVLKDETRVIRPLQAIAKA